MSDSQRRIRQVAIVLANLDATSAKRMLAQLPSDQARAVRQQIARLGEVSSDERRTAMIELQQRSTSKSKVESRVQTNAKKQKSLDDYDDDLDEGESVLAGVSPAEAILDESSGQFDGFTSYQSLDSSEPNTMARNLSEKSNRIDLSNDEAHPIESGFKSWSVPFASGNYTGPELAAVLAGERPNIIAAILQQADPALGSEILQWLPIEQSVDALAALSTIDTPDPMVLHEIQAVLGKKLAEFGEHRRGITQPKLNRISTLVASLPESQRSFIAKSLQASQPSLAALLGLSKEMRLDHSIPTLVSIPFQSAITGSDKSQPIQTIHIPSGNTTRQINMSANNATEGSASIKIENIKNDPSHSAMSTKTFHSVADLVLIDDQSLATVFQAVEPEIVLLAVSAADKPLRRRLEAMIPTNDRNRLRAKMESFRNRLWSDRIAAQRSIMDIAERLLAEGAIGLNKKMMSKAA